MNTFSLPRVWPSYAFFDFSRALIQILELLVITSYLHLYLEQRKRIIIKTQ